MSRRILLSSSVTKLIATPFLPKRPPRPILQRREMMFRIAARAWMDQLCNKQCSLPMNVVLSVCREVIVNDQGNLLDVNSTSLRGEENDVYTITKHILVKSKGLKNGLLKCSCRSFISNRFLHEENPLWRTSPDLPKV